MPFIVERNDLARMHADAIVITANEGLQINGAAGLAVARAAGLSEMQAACDALGGCPTGQAVATPAFALDADHVVHVVGPVWQGGTQGEEAVLRQAYDSALACADKCGASTIALPLVSARTFGFPVRLSFVIAVEAIKAFLEDHDDAEVHLVLFGDEAMAVGSSLYDNIAEYIDSHYVEEAESLSNSVQSVSYFREQPLQSPPFTEKREERVSAPTDESYAAYGAHPVAEPRQKPSKRRPGPLAALGGVIGGAFDQLSSARESAREESLEESFAKDGAWDLEASFADRDRSGEDELGSVAASPASGFCPHCGMPVQEETYCPWCGCHLAFEQRDESLRVPEAAFPPVQDVPRFEGAPEPTALAAMRPPSPAGPAGGSLTSWLDRLDAPFSTTLLALIDERGLTDAQVYKRANMSRQLFSKIRSDASYRPAKKTVLALSIALELDLGETADLLQRAGFALSRSNRADLIVEYFILKGDYDIFAVNEALFAFDQPTL